MKLSTLRSLVVAMLLGVVINTSVAQLLGWFVIRPRSFEWQYIPAGDDACEVGVYRGYGRVITTFRVLDRQGAAVWQDIRAKSDRPRLRSDPDYAPANAVPLWSSAWQPRHVGDAKAVNAAATRTSALVSGPVDVGLGFPWISYVVSLEPRIMPADPTVVPPPVYRSGFMSDPARVGFYDIRALAWKPAWPGVLCGSLLWGAFAWVLLLVTRRARARMRRVRGRCESCGYSRAGLVANAKCPECGTLGANSNVRAA